jgi:hypothetical protein
MIKSTLSILTLLFLCGCATNGTTTVILKGDKKFKITEREAPKETVNKINKDADDMKAASNIIFYPSK